MKTNYIKKGCTALDNLRLTKENLSKHSRFDTDLVYKLNNLDSTTKSEVEQALLEVLQKREQSIINEIKEKVNL